MSVHCSSDYCFVEIASDRLSFTFCCGLVCLSDVIARAQVNRLYDLDDLFVVFYESVESAEVIGFLKCRCLLRCLILFCRFL